MDLKRCPICNGEMIQKDYGCECQNCKEIDYDAAKVFHRGKNEDTTLIGTVGRAAPEQFGFAQSDARTDVYSMGCLVRELLPNDKRFSGIIAKATAMDPKDRYQTVAELKGALSGTSTKHSGKRNLLWVIIPTIVSVMIENKREIKDVNMAFRAGYESGIKDP